MNPVIKVAIAVALVATLLWWAIGKFLIGTDEISDSLDVRSLSYLRDDGASKSVSRESNSVNAGVSDTRSANSVIVRRTESVQVEPADLQDEDKAEEDEEDSSDEKELSADAPEAEPAMFVDTDSAAVEVIVIEADDMSADVVEGNEEDITAGLAGAVIEGESPATPGLEGSKLPEGLVDEPEETEAEARARKLKEKLGIKKPKPPTRAVDVALVLSSECDGSGVALAPVSVQFRFESPTIRGRSLNQLEILVAEFRDCPDSVFQLTENVLGKVDSTPSLTQMRFDELKYFFIQHSVPKTALRYPESS